MINEFVLINHLQIDEYEENIFPFKLAKSQDTKFNNLKTIYIGRNGMLA